MKESIVKGATERGYGYEDRELVDDSGKPAPAAIRAIAKRIGFDDFDIHLEWEATIESERETNYSGVESVQPIKAFAVSMLGVKAELTSDEAAAVATEWEDEINDQAGESSDIYTGADFQEYDADRYA